MSFFWVPPPEGRLHPSVIEMLGVKFSFAPTSFMPIGKRCYLTATVPPIQQPATAPLGLHLGAPCRREFLPFKKMPIIAAPFMWLQNFAATYLFS